MGERYAAGDVTGSAAGRLGARGNRLPLGAAPEVAGRAGACSVFSGAREYRSASIDGSEASGIVSISPQPHLARFPAMAGFHANCRPQVAHANFDSAPLDIPHPVFSIDRFELVGSQHAHIRFKPQFLSNCCLRGKGDYPVASVRFDSCETGTGVTNPVRLCGLSGLQWGEMTPGCAYQFSGKGVY